MATQINRSSSITCTINYIYNNDTDQHESILPSKSDKAKKTSKWSRRRLFKRTDRHLVADSYYQFDQLLDSEYPFPLKENHHDRTSFEMADLSVSDWSLTSNTSQSSTESSTSDGLCAKHQKKSIPYKTRIRRQQKKASAKVEPCFLNWLVDVQSSSCHPNSLFIYLFQ